MDNITIYCHNNESIEYSKNRFLAFTQSFVDDEVIIPQSKEDVIIFLNFLDTHVIPVMKPDHNKEKTIALLDNAQYCNLKPHLIPGKHFLIDLIYENMENEFGVKFSYLCDFVEETNMDLYDYNFCKFVIYQWSLFLTYGMFMDNSIIKKQQIEKIIKLM